MLVSSLRCCLKEAHHSIKSGPVAPTQKHTNGKDTLNHRQRPVASLHLATKAASSISANECHRVASALLSEEDRRRRFWRQTSRSPAAVSHSQGPDALKICSLFAHPVGGGGGRNGGHKMASTALHQFLNGTPDDCGKSILAPGQIHFLVLLGYHVDSDALVCSGR